MFKSEAWCCDSTTCTKNPIWRKHYCSRKLPIRPPIDHNKSAKTCSIKSGWKVWCAIPDWHWRSKRWVTKSCTHENRHIRMLRFETLSQQLIYKVLSKFRLKHPDRQSMKNVKLSLLIMLGLDDDGCIPIEKSHAIEVYWDFIRQCLRYWPARQLA